MTKDNGPLVLSRNAVGEYGLFDDIVVFEPMVSGIWVTDTDQSF